MKTQRYCTDWSANAMNASFEYSSRKYGGYSIACIGNQEVHILVPETVYDKEVILHCQHYGEYKHLPNIKKLGWCAISGLRGRKHKAAYNVVYHMPLYYKLRSDHNKFLFGMLEDEWNRIDVFYPVFNNGKKLDHLHDWLIESDIQEYQDLASLVYVSRDFREDWKFEVAKSNVMEDINGNIIWLDMLFVR